MRVPYLPWAGFSSTCDSYEQSLSSIASYPLPRPPCLYPPSSSPTGWTGFVIIFLGACAIGGLLAGVGLYSGFRMGPGGPLVGVALVLSLIAHILTSIAACRLRGLPGIGEGACCTVATKMHLEDSGTDVIVVAGAPAPAPAAAPIIINNNNNNNNNSSSSSMSNNMMQQQFPGGGGGGGWPPSTGQAKDQYHPGGAHGGQPSNYPSDGYFGGAHPHTPHAQQQHHSPYDPYAAGPGNGGAQGYPGSQQQQPYPAQQYPQQQQQAAYHQQPAYELPQHQQTQQHFVNPLAAHGHAAASAARNPTPASAPLEADPSDPARKGPPAKSKQQPLPTGWVVKGEGFVSPAGNRHAQLPPELHRLASGLAAGVEVDFTDEGEAYYCLPSGETVWERPA